MSFLLLQGTCRAVAKIINRSNKNSVSAPPNRKSMGQSTLLMIFCIQTMKRMKLKTERDLSYIDPFTVEFFQNNQTSSISVILLTNGQTDGRTEGQTNGRDFNTSLAEVKIMTLFNSALNLEKKIGNQNIPMFRPLKII